MDRINILINEKQSLLNKLNDYKSLLNKIKSKNELTRLYKNEKKTIINRSGGNISNYVDLVIMDFINKISENYRR